MFFFIHQYAYFFSLMFFVLPISIAFDVATGFLVIKKLLTLRGIFALIVTVIFWSAYDIFWVHKLGYFPPDRIVGAVGGVPIEEMILFPLGLYHVGAIFTWSKMRFS